MRKLYLGLKAPLGTYHYPVIRTQTFGQCKAALHLWSKFTHIIVTSQTTVTYWPGPWDKQIIAIGPATASFFQQPLMPIEFTQEGLIELISQIPGYFFYPHSRNARPNLVEFMQKNKIPFFDLAIYETVFQKLEPVPDLVQFDEIIFTSPSTVQGFLNIYGALPKDKKLSCIGPVTEKFLAQSQSFL